MSDVIGLLERIGQDARWSQALPDDIQLALADADLDAELHSAIVLGNDGALLSLLGLFPICGMLVPGKEDEKEDEDTEETPPDNDDDKPEQSLSQHLVFVS